MKETKKRNVRGKALAQIRAVFLASGWSSHSLIWLDENLKAKFFAI
jgi:hypothetical protein